MQFGEPEMIKRYLSSVDRKKKKKEKPSEAKISCETINQLLL